MKHIVAISAFFVAFAMFLGGQFAASFYWLSIGCGSLIPVRFSLDLDNAWRFFVVAMFFAVMAIVFVEESGIQIVNALFGSLISVALVLMFGKSLYDADEDEYGVLMGGWWPLIGLACFITLTQLVSQRGWPAPGIDQIATGMSFFSGRISSFETLDPTEAAWVPRFLERFTSPDLSEDIATVRVAATRELWLLIIGFPLGSVLQLLWRKIWQALGHSPEVEQGDAVEGSWNWVIVPPFAIAFLLAPHLVAALLLVVIGASRDVRKLLFHNRWGIIVVGLLVTLGLNALSSGTLPPVTRVLRPGLFKLTEFSDGTIGALPLDQRAMLHLSDAIDNGLANIGLGRGYGWLAMFALAIPGGFSLARFAQWLWQGLMKYEGSTTTEALNNYETSRSEDFPEDDRELVTQTNRPDANLPETVDSVSAGEPAPKFAEIDFGQYEILDVIGRGGMGRVYKARHKRLGRVVALKTILTSASSHSGAMRRFQEEAESAARLDHPAIVPVYEFGSAKGELYFTMAYVEGQSLAERLNSGPVEARQAAYFVQQAAIAAAFAHERGVVHRDLKPGNILLDRDGSVKVTDFGLARRLDVLEAESEAPADFPFLNTYETVCRLTLTGAVMGTPAYMAPEQALDAKRAGPPADVWALGAVLFVCLTGRTPFHSENAMETLTLLIEADPPAPRSLNPVVDFDLEAICVRCLQKKETDRYASASELAADLNRWLSGQTPRAARLTWTEHLRRLDVAYPEVLTLLAGSLALFVGNLQEAIFVVIALGMMRLVSAAPNLQQMLVSGVIWSVVSAAGPVMSMIKHSSYDVPTDEFLVGFDEKLATISLPLSAIAGFPLGVLFAFGSEASAGIAEWLRWVWRGGLLLGIGLFIATYVLSVNGRHVVIPSSSFFWPWFYRDGGVVPALFMVVPLAVSVGALLQRLQSRITRQRGVSGKWARFFVPGAAALAACSTLLLAAWIPFSDLPILLDLTGYCGPGPLLTHTEQTFRNLSGLPVLATWTIIFFGKFWLLTLPMALATVIVSVLLREREVK